MLLFYPHMFSPSPPSPTLPDQLHPLLLPPLPPHRHPPPPPPRPPSALRQPPRPRPGPPEGNQVKPLNQPNAIGLVLRIPTHPTEAKLLKSSSFFEKT